MHNKTTNLDLCNSIENLLTYASVIPVVGAIAGVTKAMLGTIQATIALALGIFSLPFRCNSDDAKAFNDHCFSHVIHGLGNVVGGLGEAILSLTIIGGICLLSCRVQGSYDKDPYHQDKFIPYSDLIARDVAALPHDYLPRDIGYTTKPHCMSPTNFRNAIHMDTVPYLFATDDLSL